MLTIQKLKKHPIIKFLSSIKIIVVCLLLLFLLVFFGTIDQVTHGLFHAQEKYFNSLIFFAFGFLPVPGAQLVLWVMFVNLICVSITRFVYKSSHIGILIIHFGLLSYFVAAYVTFQCAIESNITLREKASSNVSVAYHKWELSLWPENELTREVTAFDTDKLKVGDALKFQDHDLTARLELYYTNSSAYRGRDGTKQYTNDSGIGTITRIQNEKEPAKNFPGAVFLFPATDQGDVKVLLYGGEDGATTIVKDGQRFHVQLRRKRYPIPFSLKLKDFRKEVHPNTETARSYESLVAIEQGTTSRDVLISMNEPLRYRNYSFYQASYGIDQFGRELSTLAVVKNSGRLLPYFSSLITFIGLVVHFLTMAITQRKKVS